MGRNRRLLLDGFLVGFLEARGDDGDFHGVFHGVVHDRTKNNVRVFVRSFLDDRRSFVNFMQGEAGAAGNVDQDALRALDGIVFEQRTGNGAVGGVDGAIRSGGNGGAHHGVALAVHDGFHVGKVAVDNARHGDDVGNALDGLAEDVVGDAERVEETGAALDGFHQAFVGDHDDGVDGANQFLQGLFRLQHAALAFESKRLRDNRDAQSAEFAGERSYYGRSAAAGASAEAGGDENHVRAFERFNNFVSVFEGSFAADLGIRARAEPFGEFRAELQLHGSLRELERLQVGIGRDEFDAFDFGADHAVNCVASAAAHADDFNLRGLQLLAEAHANSCIFRRHASLSLLQIRDAALGQGYEAPANMDFNLFTRFPARCGAFRRVFAPYITRPTTVAYSGCATCSGRSAKPFGSAIRTGKWKECFGQLDQAVESRAAAREHKSSGDLSVKAGALADRRGSARAIPSHAAR